MPSSTIIGKTISSTVRSLPRPIGDKRYNDQVSDYSVKAYNEGLAREQGFLLRLAAIDPAGLTDQEKTSRDLLLRQFTEDQEAAEFKEWEMPVNQMGGIYSTYPQLVAQLSFTTVKDYDDWIARLHAIPTAFEQVTTDMSIGVDDHRVPPKYLLEKTLEQVRQLASQKPEDSPLALPLKNFPAAIPAAEQERIKDETLKAIAKQVLPAYQRFARFLEVTYIPAGREQPGIATLADGAKYYAFSIRRTTTTDLTAEQIHQIGLDEVKRDETEMLAIAQRLGFQDLKSFRASFKTNPKLKATSREALLAAYRGYLTPMQAKLPSLFGRLPKAPFEVTPVPDYLEKTSAPAYYEAGTPDGSTARPLAHRHLQCHRPQPVCGRVHRLPRRPARPPPAGFHRAGDDRHSHIPQVQRFTRPTGGLGALCRAAG